MEDEHVCDLTVTLAWHFSGRRRLPASLGTSLTPYRPPMPTSSKSQDFRSTPSSKPIQSDEKTRHKITAGNGTIEKASRNSIKT
jgi:hypothetical protein